MYLPWYHSEETAQPGSSFIAISKPDHCGDKLLGAIPNECTNHTLRVISPAASFEFLDIAVIKISIMQMIRTTNKYLVENRNAWHVGYVATSFQA